MVLPLGGRVRDARELEKIRYHAVVPRSLSVDVTGEHSILVTRMRSAVAVIKRPSMSETAFNRWTRRRAGKVHISGWHDVVRVLIRRERNPFKRALHFLLGLIVESPLA
jgi:hypothetical protein